MNTNFNKEIVHEVKAFRNFRRHLSIYVILMACIWLFYWASAGVINLDTWPMYISLFWGLGLVIHLIIAYRAFQRIKK